MSFHEFDSHSPNVFTPLHVLSIPRETKGARHAETLSSVGDLSEKSSRVHDCFCMTARRCDLLRVSRRNTLGCTLQPCWLDCILARLLHLGHWACHKLASQIPPRNHCGQECLLIVCAPYRPLPSPPRLLRLRHLDLRKRQYRRQSIRLLLRLLRRRRRHLLPGQRRR